MDLYGWDMVYGASAEVINRQLKDNSKNLITDFHYKRNETEIGVEIEITGQFGSWSVTKGGSNKLVHVSIPIAKGSMVVTGKTDVLFKNTPFQAGQPVDLSDTEMIVELSLSFKVSAQDPTVRELIFDFVAKDGGTTAPSSIKPIAVNDPKNKLPTASLKGFFKQIFVEVLGANKDKMSFVFASVLTAGGKNSWATLKYIDFYYSEPTGSAIGFFTILGLTFRDNAIGLDAKIDPAFFQKPDTNLYIGLSRDIFLQNIIKPLLPNVIGHGTTAVTFAYDMAQHRIVAAPIGLGPLREGAIDYWPVLTATDIHIEDNAIRTSFSGRCDISPGIVEVFSFSYKNVVSYNYQKNAFEVQADRNPVTSHDSQIEWWVYLVSFGTGALLIGGVVLGITACITTAIGDDMDRLGSSLHFDTLSGLPIEWNGIQQNKLKVLSAGLSSNIFITGQY